ncbi:MAG TPA: hypothetical protein VFL71_01585 [Actinomycetes bacterium]|nr:hypothetical protein [Actinomycetes bacterium]
MPGRAVRAPLVVAAAALAALMAASVVAPAGPPPARGAPAEQRTAEQRTTRLQAQGTDPAGLPGPARRPAGRLPHGNDVPPPGVSLFHRPSLEELRERTTLRSPSPRLRGLAALGQATTGAAGLARQAAVPCIGDGTSGNRVQMVYARSALAPDRYDELLPDFRQWAAEVDQAVWLSAGETGGGRHLRPLTLTKAPAPPPGAAAAPAPPGRRRRGA